MEGSCNSSIGVTGKGSSSFSLGFIGETVAGASIGYFEEGAFLHRRAELGS